MPTADRTHQALDYYSFDHPLSYLRSIVSLRARRKMFHLFMELAAPTPEERLIDMGVTPDESQAESNFFEQVYPYKERLIAASIEDAGYLEQKFSGVHFLQLRANPNNYFIQEDTGQRLPDDAFDSLFCNAVLEHVGNREQQRLFMEECLRVARKVFITTPNRWFPIEMHTFLPLLHWLPMTSFRKILSGLGRQFMASEKNLNLLTPRQLRQIIGQSAEIKKAQVTYRHVRTCGWPSNMIIYLER